jgi:hypothetical protein
MSQFGRIEVSDREGWRREHPIQKNILHVGSDARNDIVLDTTHGTGVAPRHLQLIAIDQGFRMVNIGSTDVSVGAMSERAVPPLGVLDIGSGERVKVGDFILTFHGGGTAGGMPQASAPASAIGGGVGVATIPGSVERTTSGAIGLTVSFANVMLSPTRPLDGVVNIRNLGDRTGAQFKLEIEGLDPEYYEMGPGPILFPGAEKSVSLRLQHPRQPEPAAGDLRLRIRATAPTAYPGESAAVTQIIRVLPFHAYRMRLVIPE